MNTINNKNDGILLQSGNNEVEFIEFNVRGVNYGINVAKVERVLARPTVSIRWTTTKQLCCGQSMCKTCRYSLLI